MAEPRIQVYMDSETKRRVEVAATKIGIPITQYCLQAIKQQLADDDMLDQDTVEIRIKPLARDDQLVRLRTLHEEIMAYRSGEPLDVEGVLDQVRQERDRELTDLH